MGGHGGDRCVHHLNERQFNLHHLNGHHLNERSLMLPFLYVSDLGKISYPMVGGMMFYLLLFLLGVGGYDLYLWV